MEQSNITRQSWQNAKNLLNDVGVYSLFNTIELLKKNNYCEILKGRGRNRTLLKENPKLFKSIYYYSKDLEDKMKESGRYASAYNFSHRIDFIVKCEADIDKLRCKCGQRYSWTGYCRHCSEAKNTFARMSDEEKTLRNLKASKTMRCKIGEEMRRDGKSPRYDVESIAVLDKFATTHGLKLQHAENGGEKYLRDLGYWLDGYDVERNVVVEIDEPFHFRKELNLLERDIKRHEQIQNYLGCTIYHIYFNKRTGRTVLYNTPDTPNNWNVNKGIDLTEVVGFAKNGTKKYSRYAEK